MTDSKFLVVGAGPTGLGCASELAGHGTVTVIERIPVPGGTAGWDNPNVVAVTETARRAGVQFLLGETALRWDRTNLLVVGPGTVRHLPGDHLFFAGGLRPATAANLSIDGDRPAGVLPATVAEHLLHSGVKLWDTALVVGDGPWVHHVGLACRKLGTRVIAVTENDHGGLPEWADEHHPWPDTLTVVGRERVSAVRLRTSVGEVAVSCDAVVLAASPRPNRNVNGALFDGDADVTFLQPVQPDDTLERYHAGRAAARAWLDENGDLR